MTTKCKHRIKELFGITVPDLKKARDFNLHIEQSVINKWLDKSSAGLWGNALMELKIAQDIILNNAGKKILTYQWNLTKSNGYGGYAYGPTMLTYCFPDDHLSHRGVKYPLLIHVTDYFTVVETFGQLQWWRENYANYLFFEQKFSYFPCYGATYEHPKKKVYYKINTFPVTCCEQPITKYYSIEASDRIKAELFNGEDKTIKTAIVYPMDRKGILTFYDKNKLQPSMFHITDARHTNLIFTKEEPNENQHTQG